MPADLTWGFELEWQDGLRPMLPLLHDVGHLPDQDLHPYHCECRHCDPHGSYNLRCQSDSSCNGELISRVMSGVSTHEVELFSDIQRAATAVDAIPGMSAGMHVHVGAGHLGRLQRGRMLHQWLNYEPAMHVLARGRFEFVRSFNPTMWSALQWAFDTFAEEVWEDSGEELAVSPAKGSRRFFDAIVDTPGETRNTYLRWLAAAAEDLDRHGALSTNTRYGTFEFRLWNSTRSAWRMEMFTRLSLAWMDPGFFDHLSTVPSPWATGGGEPWPSFDDVKTVIGALDASNHGRAAELAQRQLDYITTTSGTQSAFAA